jgi:hypothetical protein
VIPKRLFWKPDGEPWWTSVDSRLIHRSIFERQEQPDGAGGHPSTNTSKTNYALRVLSKIKQTVSCRVMEGTSEVEMRADFLSLQASATSTTPCFCHKTRAFFSRKVTWPCSFSPPGLLSVHFASTLLCRCITVALRHRRLLTVCCSRVLVRVDTLAKVSTTDTNKLPPDMHLAYKCHKADTDTIAGWLSAKAAMTG